MPSKYRTTFQLNQNQMDSIADKFPEINDIMKFPSFKTVLQYLIEKIISGELVEKEQSAKDDIDAKIKQQKYLGYCLDNWKKLKENGTIYEEAKAIITGHKEIQAPEMQQMISNQAPPQEKGFDQFYSCFTCKHTHSKSQPHVCTLLTCNCGVRG